MNGDLLAIIQKLKREIGHDPGKKQLHKIVYLIQAKGVELGYEYGIHFYGPYSEELSHDLLSLYVNGLVDFRIKGQTHEIVPTERFVEMSVSPASSKKIDSIIRQYKDSSPSYLELVTTAHFAAKSLGTSDQNIMDGVVRIKGGKYPEAQIRKAINHLREEYAI